MLGVTFPGNPFLDEEKGIEVSMVGKIERKRGKESNRSFIVDHGESLCFTNILVFFFLTVGSDAKSVGAVAGPNWVLISPPHCPEFLVHLAFPPSVIHHGLVVTEQGWCILNLPGPRSWSDTKKGQLKRASRTREGPAHVSTTLEQYVCIYDICIYIYI